MASDPRAITKSAYEQARTQFENFLRYDNSHSPLKDAHQWFTWNDLSQLVNAVAGNLHGIAIYYGLVDDHLCFGIRVLRFVPTGNPPVYDYVPALDSAQGARPTHLLRNNTFVAIGTADWDALGNTYFVHMRVDRVGDGNFAPLDKRYDPKAIVLPWEDELLRLWIDNQAAIGSQSARILLSSIARYHTEEHETAPDGYRHGVSMHVQVMDATGSWRDLLDDIDHSPADYQQKAADLGSMCPPRCKKYSDG